MYDDRYNLKLYFNVTNRVTILENFDCFQLTWLIWRGKAMKIAYCEMNKMNGTVRVSIE